MESGMFSLQPEEITYDNRMIKQQNGSYRVIIERLLGYLIDLGIENIFLALEGELGSFGDRFSTDS